MSEDTKAALATIKRRIMFEQTMHGDPCPRNEWSHWGADDGEVRFNALCRYRAKYKTAFETLEHAVWHDDKIVGATTTFQVVDSDRIFRRHDNRSYKIEVEVKDYVPFNATMQQRWGAEYVLEYVLKEVVENGKQVVGWRCWSLGFNEKHRYTSLELEACWSAFLEEFPQIISPDTQSNGGELK